MSKNDSSKLALDRYRRSDDDVLVIDMEWDWIGADDRKLEYKDFELIEIGAVASNPTNRCNYSHEIVFDQLVQPVAKNFVSKGFELLTGITTEAVREEGVPLAKGLEAFLKIAKQYKKWAFYGGRDQAILQFAARRAGIEPYLPMHHYDIKQAFSSTYKLKKGPSLVRALRMTESPKFGELHRAVDDAAYAARIYWHTINHKEIDIVSDRDFEEWLARAHPEIIRRQKAMTKEATRRDVLSAWSKNRDKRELPHLDTNTKGRPGVWCQLFDIDKMLMGKDIDMIEMTSSNGHHDEIRVRAARFGHMRLAKMPTRDNIRALDNLATQFANFDEVIKEIKGRLINAHYSNSPVQFDPILLDGPPGVGKTEFSRQLATTLELPFFEFNIASAHGRFEVCGGHPGWSHAEPGRITKYMLSSDFSNPIVLMDEIEAARAVQGESVVQPLLQFLDREQSRRVRDNNLDLQFDFSGICFIATTNELRFVGDALKSRFRIFDIKPPTKAQVREIAKSIYNKIRSERKAFYLCESLCDEVIDSISAMPPRAIRSALSQAINAATLRLSCDGVVSEGALVVEDLPNQGPDKLSFGFVPGGL